MSRTAKRVRLHASANGQEREDEMPTSTRCPKCDGSMSDGFIVDEMHGMYRVSTWQSGAPQKSIWTGIKQRKADQMKVSTRRCERCGYLESYALLK